MGTLTFVSHLTQLAERLTSVLPELRNDYLREGLNEINQSYGAQALGTAQASSIVYVPIGSTNNRLGPLHATV